MRDLPQLNRRSFVEQALATAAVSLAGLKASAADLPKRITRTVGPSEKLRVAVIGLNGRGSTHVGEWIANPDADLVAVSDCDPNTQARYEKRFQDMLNPPRFESDFRRLLDDKEIDIISIATPNHWHALMTVWAMQAGKDVYVEKPCSYTVEEHYDWHWDLRTGNGDLGNQNPHEIDKARWGLGKQELPKRVVSTGGRLGYVDNGDAANSQLTLFAWDDALLISEVRGLEITEDEDFGLKAGPLRVANIWWGTEGYAVSPNYRTGVAFDYDGNELGKWQGGSDQLHFANFVKGVKSRNHEDLHLDIEDGHLSSALAHLGNVSWKLGEAADLGSRPDFSVAGDTASKAVSDTFASFEKHLAANNVDVAETPYAVGRELVIDPVTEKSSDAEANRLFAREYRQGYELPKA
ncbi:gfo/Idh/MocA family oxidoreductase [bacterium]|nr:gfo/Idh/MocA family oxidoreductase [bacterium]